MTTRSRPHATTAETLKRVARTATQTGMLELNRLSLIGVYGKTGAMRALVRSAGGKIRRVAPGERLRLGVVVVGIDENGLMLQKGSRTVRLGFPAG
jgi:formate-dependent nitrite reductase membrane component NrfD